MSTPFCLEPEVRSHCFYENITSHCIWKVKVLVDQLCLTPFDPMNCSQLGSSIHGILQARRLKWLAVPFFRGMSWPRDWLQASHIAGRFFTTEPPGKPCCTVFKLSLSEFVSHLNCEGKNCVLFIFASLVPRRVAISCFFPLLLSFILLLYLFLMDHCFIVLCWFLPNINIILLLLLSSIFVFPQRMLRICADTDILPPEGSSSNTSLRALKPTHPAPEWKLSPQLLLS